jgi:hypothetical protein
LNFTEVRCRKCFPQGRERIPILIYKTKQILDLCQAKNRCPSNACSRHENSNVGEKLRFIRSWSPPGVKTKKPDHFWSGSGNDGVLGIPLPGIPHPHRWREGVDPGTTIQLYVLYPPCSLFDFLTSYLRALNNGTGHLKSEKVFWVSIIFSKEVITLRQAYCSAPIRKLPHRSQGISQEVLRIRTVRWAMRSNPYR